MPTPSSPEQPLAVRVVAGHIADWIGRLGVVWIEGQLAELKDRGDSVWMTIRDVSADVSLTLVISRRVADAGADPLREGQRVVVAATPEFWTRRGTLVLRGREIRPVGLGELLARLEERRRLLAAEGLFSVARKRPLPFLPRSIGLICGRASAAERDVVENSRRRWPGVEFVIREVPVQGVAAAANVMTALAELDALPQVDVIVITRGGGSLEDLLPFSDESLLRLVADITTPVVSAIGHEQDVPLLDLVADVRASTPTHAASLIVPDVGELAADVERLRHRIGDAANRRIDQASQTLGGLRHRLPDPTLLVGVPAQRVLSSVERIRLLINHRIDSDAAGIDSLRARVRSLSPAATLERGYAIVLNARGDVITSPDEVAAQELLNLRVSRGSIGVQVIGP